MPIHSRHLVALSFAFPMSLPAQHDPQPAPSLLPLHEDARWTYELDRPAGADGAAQPTTLVIVDEGGFSLPGLGRVHQLRTVAGTTTTFECWSVRDDGIYLHRVTDATHRGMLDVDAPPFRVLALPHDGTAMEQVTVPAGTFRAVRVQLPVEATDAARTRTLWLAPGVGIVRDEIGDGTRRELRQLKAHAAGRDTRGEVLLAALEQDLRDPAKPPYNMTPAIVWVEPVEAMLLRGRIAIVKAETWTRCFYVDPDGAMPFDYRDASSTAPIVRKAFGGGFLPPEWAPLRSLALLLARTHAARCELGDVREVTPTLLPRRDPPARGRSEHVEVAGGGNDGTVKRVAVWVTIDRRSEIQVVSDAEPPGKML